MNKPIKHILFLSYFLMGLIIYSCEDLSQELTSLTTDRVFQPIKFAAAINKTQVTFTWAPVVDAVSYTLQVSTDSLNFSTMAIDTTITNLTYVQELAGSTAYFARIKANAIDETKSSKFNSTLSFKTPAENLFFGFIAKMTDMNTIEVKWTPGANVTHLLLTAADNTTKMVPISLSEKTVGDIVVASLENSTYKVQLYNNDILRGTSSFIVEGDTYLASGSDLPTALANASSGQVLVLEPGAIYPLGSTTFRFNKNVKLKCFSETNRPVLCLTNGTPSATSSMLGFEDGSTLQYVKFENIDFTGYCDNNTASIKIGYLFNNNLMTNVSNLSFKNCNLHNFGNTTMRVQGGKNQTIDSLIFNKCTIYDIGFNSTYAIVNSNSADFINYINFDNCAIYNFKGSLVLRTGQPMKTISVSNCTINQGMLDPSSSRYLIDANTSTFTGSGIVISNCIFGSSGGVLGANGVRQTSGALTVAGSYYTNDYIDDPVSVVISYSIKKYMTAYSGASTSLWNDPLNGFFSFKDASFAGKNSAGAIFFR
ncbi:MAG: DUF4957 domain-containing protein [Bacteroidales bacterium]|nr:DUF4957 domain-containing protein [Bacteroidales bacterium]